MPNTPAWFVLPAGSIHTAAGMSAIHVENLLGDLSGISPRTLQIDEIAHAWTDGLTIP